MVGEQGTVFARRLSESGQAEFCRARVETSPSGNRTQTSCCIQFNGKGVSL